MRKGVYFCFSSFQISLQVVSYSSHLTYSEKQTPQINKSKMLRYLRLSKNDANIFIKSISFEAKDLNYHGIHLTEYLAPLAPSTVGQDCPSG